MVSVIEKRGRPKKRTTPFPTYDVVARTFLQEKYNTERWHQMVSEPVRTSRPFWLYDAIIDGRETVLCHGLNGTLLPWDDLFWQFRKPPNHWGCRSIIRAVTRHTASRRGITVNVPTVMPKDGFGMSPKFQSDTRFLNRAKYNSRLLTAADRKLRKPRPERDVPKPANIGQINVIGTGAEQAKEVVLKELNRAGLTKFYADRRPLGHLIFTDEQSDDESAMSAINSVVNTSGVCYTNLERTVSIKVNTDRRYMSSFARSMSMSGKLQAVQYTSTSPEQASAMVAVHELGHGIHLYRQAEKEGVAADKLVLDRWHAKDREDVSEYAKTNHKEYFAEAYTAYQFEPTWMKKQAPKAYDMVRAMLKLRGLL